MNFNKLTTLPTKSTVKGLPRKAHSFLAGKEITCYYEIWRFIAVFTKARQLAVFVPADYSARFYTLFI
jgi:hypothetical protein